MLMVKFTIKKTFGKLIYHKFFFLKNWLVSHTDTNSVPPKSTKMLFVTCSFRLQQLPSINITPKSSRALRLFLCWTTGRSFQHSLLPPSSQTQNNMRSIEFYLLNFITKTKTVDNFPCMDFLQKYPAVCWTLSKPNRHTGRGVTRSLDLIAALPEAEVCVFSKRNVLLALRANTQILQPTVA